MQMNALRKEIYELLKELSLYRTSVVRRCSHENWLYIIHKEVLRDETDHFLHLIWQSGWETKEEKEWLMIKKTAEEPPEDWYHGGFGQEASCCLSLLARHLERGEGKETVQRLLIKAGEEGEMAYEAACYSIHRDWSEKLRRNELLPDINTGYFGNGK